MLTREGSKKRNMATGSSPWLVGLLVFLSLILLWRYLMLMSLSRCPLDDDFYDDDDDRGFQVEGLTPKPKARPKPRAASPPPPSSVVIVPARRRPRSPSPPPRALPKPKPKPKPKPSGGIQLRPEAPKDLGITAARRQMVTPVRTDALASQKFQRNRSSLRPIKAPGVK